MSVKNTKRTVIIISIVVAVLILAGTIGLSVSDGGARARFLQLAYDNAQDSAAQEAWKHMGSVRTFFQRMAKWGVPAIALAYQVLLMAICRKQRLLMLDTGLTLLCSLLLGGGSALAISYAIFGHLSPDTYLYLCIGTVRTAIVWAVTAIIFWICAAVIKKKKEKI
jgi:hypothetical protein